MVRENSKRIYTIGHSNHRFDEFSQLLEANNVSQIVDVRTSPYSKYNLAFNGDAIEGRLGLLYINYSFEGKRLGGRPDDPSCYKNKKIPKEGADYLHLVDYGEIMKKEWFQAGIANLLKIAGKRVTAIMCSEEDPAKCHRHHLISKYLFEENPEIEIIHIRGDGNMFPAQMIRKTVDEKEGLQLGLFGGEGE